MSEHATQKKKPKVSRRVTSGSPRVRSAAPAGMFISWRCEACGSTGSTLKRSSGGEAEEGQIAAMLHRAIAPNCTRPIVSASISEEER